MTRKHLCGRGLVTLVMAQMSSGAGLTAQAPTVPPAEYGRWENLGGATLSPDGAWIAYGVLGAASAVNAAWVGAAWRAHFVSPSHFSCATKPRRWEPHPR